MNIDLSPNDYNKLRRSKVFKSFKNIMEQAIHAVQPYNLDKAMELQSLYEEHFFLDAGQTISLPSAELRKLYNIEILQSYPNKYKLKRNYLPLITPKNAFYIDSYPSKAIKEWCATLDKTETHYLLAHLLHKTKHYGSDSFEYYVIFLADGEYNVLSDAGGDRRERVLPQA